MSNKQAINSLLATLVLLLVTACGNNKSDENKSISSSSNVVSQMTTTTKNNEETNSTSISPTETTTESSSSKIQQRKYSFEEQKSISKEFINWASERAKIGGMAVNGAYFTHGASGRGDWYAIVPDNNYVLIQRQDPSMEISKDTYLANSIGGVVFYYSKYGTTGLSDEINDRENNPSTATGFSQVADLDKPIVKYMLADNGVVYEYSSKGSFSDGFYVTDDDGDFDYWPGEQRPFIISEDQDAQSKLQSILEKYN
ncbi:hypothetical protein [Vagococcus hydrophili]|uniref:Lipoprotein n=1 Tax=Vagococcus hydrophili TaxID=2714947 RepID=A0A6G8ATY6_9ENTE|nr:hypothetical protein [Vagococcus hydrophili]QIL48524.1 hypothetical protein G7082_08435 [Vagococcus hydrophili]